MSPIVRGTLNLEQYRCLHCSRVFYINATDKRDRDLKFRCPYGCDDDGAHEMNAGAAVEGVTEGGDSDGQ
jgi:hypothetical protein